MRVYLDFNATTPVDPAVLAAMTPYFSAEFGNASSIHSAGQRARASVEHARESVAALIGAKPAEIVFTGGGTEANNLAILGTVAPGATKRHVITTTIEHHAVLNACGALEARHIHEGSEVTYVGVGHDGLVDPENIRRAIRPDTALITVMHANNELGTIQPIEEIGKIAREAGVFFHTDAVQSAGKLPIDVDRLGVDLLSIAAHKFYGPKGVGALYVRSGVPIAPILYGGHHERDRRPGTENVPGIVGLGKTAELAAHHVGLDSNKIATLRDRFEQRLLEAVPHCFINGHRGLRIPNTTNFTFENAVGESLQIGLDLQGVACSTGAACSSGAIEPSHVLTAIGLSRDHANASLRFSLGHGTTDAEIDFALSVIPGVVERLRELAPTQAQALARQAKSPKAVAVR